MFVLEKENVVYYDVDDTLILYQNIPDGFNGPFIEIECNGIKRIYGVIQPVVDSIIEHKGRAHGVVVWSHGSVEWANAVVNALNLKDLVDVVIAKPRWIVDDLDPTLWIPKGRRVKWDGTKHIIGEDDGK